MRGHATYGRMTASHDAVRPSRTAEQQRIDKALGVRTNPYRCAVCNERLEGFTRGLTTPTEFDRLKG